MGHRDEALINRVILALEEAWNRHDAHAFAGLFAEDADFTDVLGTRAESRAGVEEYHAPIFETTFRGSQLMIEDVRVRFLKPDIATADAKWELIGVTDPSGNPEPHRKGLMSLVIANESDRWAIKVMHNMEMPISSPRTEVGTQSGMGHQWIH